MSWIEASLLSALFLGVYDLCIKHAIRDNAVLPILFFSSLTGATVWIALLLVQSAQPGLLPASLVTDPLTVGQHLQLLLKSAIVAASWIFTYFGLKHLPLSLASPIRATSPLWTLVGALLILGERPNGLELLGVVTTLVAFFGLSLAGRQEGVHFHRDKWVWFLVAGTVLGGTSSLYDKYLLGIAHYSVPTVQCWFSIYLAVLFAPFAIGWQQRWWKRNVFHWRWTIPAIALSLLVADYIYFWALRQPGSLVSVVMSLRRANTLVAFAGGLLLFRERSHWQKIFAVLGILLGIALTVMG
jgi:drug/metabolite transporter (DMT)-like permease